MAVCGLSFSRDEIEVVDALTVFSSGCFHVSVG